MPYFVLPVNWAGAPQLSKGLFEGFQHLLQHAFNTLLNLMFGAFEQVFQHHWKQKMLKACWKRVKSSLDWFKLSSNIDSIFPLFSKMLNGLFRWFQCLPNICSTFVERMLVKCWNRLNGPLSAHHQVVCMFSGASAYDFLVTKPNLSQT